VIDMKNIVSRRQVLESKGHQGSREQTGKDRRKIQVPLLVRVSVTS
jgi:hypothetical protein